MADVRQIASVSANIEATTAAAGQREIAAVFANVDATTATAGRREIAAVFVYVEEVTPLTSPLHLYGVQFVDDDGNPTSVMGKALAGDRSAWDTDDYADLHAKDISDNVPIYHLPTEQRSPGDIPYWDGDKWTNISLLEFITTVLTDEGLI